MSGAFPEADRRIVVLGMAAGALGGAIPAEAKENGMFGLIGKMTVQDGKRDAVVAALIESSAAIPGCLSYIVATDPLDANAIWVTEAWDSKESHDASLQLPAVQKAIALARPFITGMNRTATTTPVGGYGLKSGGAAP